MRRLGLGCATIGVALLVMWGGAVRAGTAPRPTEPTPNQFYARGTPTFVLGTAGDDRSDRAIAAQVALIRGLVFSEAKVIRDTDIDVAAGEGAWPPNPVVYGGAHVNHVLQALALTLPLSVTAGRIGVGETSFDGPDLFLLAAIPRRDARAPGPGYPEFLLYAGTGTPGIAEINSISHGRESLLIADPFGRHTAGRWSYDERGHLTAVFGRPARRIPWRTVERPLPGSDGAGVVSFRFPAQLPAKPSEAEVIASCLRGLTRAVQKLRIGRPASLTAYIYPDRGSKRSLTGDAGDGHAVVAARVLHMTFGGPPTAAMEGLVAHEGTHVLAHAAWGPAGTPLVGEGLAVWVAGQYGGSSLADWRARVDRRAAVATLLGPAFPLR